MKLYIKQKVFSWGDKFTVYDENGNDRYYVEGEVFTLGKKLHLLDTNRNEIAFIHQEIFSFLPRYYVTVNGAQIAEIKKEFTFFHHEYTVKGLGWSVSGDFFTHDFEVTANGQTVASVQKEWFTFGDAYAIDIAPAVNEINALAVVLVIDACIDAQNND